MTGYGLIEQIETQMRAAPGHTAVVSDDQRLSYGELAIASNTVRQALVDLNVEPGSRVAVVGDAATWSVASLVALWQCNAVYMPLSPNVSVALLDRQLEFLRPRVVIAPIGSSCLESTEPVLRLDDVGVEIEVSSETAGATENDFSHIAMTSGTSGRPKAVAVGR